MSKKLLIVFIFSILYYPAFSFGKIVLPAPGITPDSIYYSLDIFAEKVVLFFTFDTESKIEKSLGFAAERLSEMEKMITKRKINLLSRINLAYGDCLEFAEKQMQEMEYAEFRRDKAAYIAERILEYQEVLVEFWSSDSPEAKLKIENALEISRDKFTEVLESAGQKQKEELIKKQEELNEKFEKINSAFMPPEAEETELQPEDSEIEEEIFGFNAEEKERLKECKSSESSYVFDIVKCYKDLGMDFSNLNLCSRAGDFAGFASCYGGAGFSMGTIGLCKQFAEIPSEGASTIALSACYGSFAQFKQEPKLCDQAPNFKSKVGCYLLLAGLEKDIKVCENIIQGIEGCYIVVASEKKDLSVCSEIEDSALKNLCLLSVASERVGKKDLCKIGESLGLFSEQDCIEHLERQ